MNKKLEKVAKITLEKIRLLTRHIRNVEDNCLLLGEKLIQSGEIDLGHQLIANGFVHDASKFHGIEWDNLTLINTAQEEENVAKLKLKLAINHHNTTNRHHPESWSGGIQDMPDVYLAEFCCDIKARSEEFGSDLRQWIDDYAIKKWKFEKGDETYNKIMKFVDMLCEKQFIKI